MSELKIKAIVEAYCRKVPLELGTLTQLLNHIQPDVSCNDDLVKLAHAQAHRLSGAAYCMGFDKMGGLLSRLENDLSRLRNGSIWESESAKLRIAKTWSAIGYEKQDVRPERSALVAEFTAPPTVGKRNILSDQIEQSDALLSGHHVLVVDDDAAVRYLVRNMLLRAGAADVTLAASGVEALESLAAFQPTFIISDWNMPVMSGMQLLSQIRQGRTPALQDTLVIFLTKERQRTKFRAAIDLGVDYFVLKPFTQQSIMYAVRAVLRRAELNDTPKAVLRTLQQNLVKMVQETVVSSRATNRSA